MSPPHLVTEDTPPDMLAGNMDIRLVLPNGNRVKMSVDRRTPMMDLLVHLTTAYKMSPANHVLQPYGESGLLPYKPSTPIGALDTWTVHIVPKNQATQNPANKILLKQVVQPFEQTCRFQVNLPRNQLYVMRVSGRTTMSEVLRQACKEKELDPKKYILKHPKHLDGPGLCDDLSIAEYGHNQVTMISSRTIQNTISTEDMVAMKNYSKSSGSSRSLSPDSSVSPRVPVQPSRPLRKRRPAPKPPVLSDRKPDAPVICHSRTSSDSSGYHEASVLSEGPDSNNSSLPDSLPRRSKLPEKPINKLSRSLSNLHHASTSHAGMKPAQSTSSLAPSRKKKPAPPPPVAIEEEAEPLTPRVSSTLPPGARLVPEPAVVHEQVDSQVVQDEKTLSDLETERIEEEIERMFDQATREHVSLESGVDVNESPELNNQQNEDPFDWEYKLPAPPTFRDEQSSPTVTEYSTMTVGNMKEVLYDKNVEEKVVVEKMRSPPPPVLVSLIPKDAKKKVVDELSTVIANGATLKKPIVEKETTKLDNFKITTYTSKPVQVYEDRLVRRSSFVENVKKSPVKRSVSNVSFKSPVERSVSKLSRFSKSNTNLVELKEEPIDFSRARLRKTNSEISVCEANVIDEEPGLQSLQVLRTILPQLSQSQIIETKKPNVSLSTWGDRPKRQVSIKSDKDYVFGQAKAPKVEPKPKVVEKTSSPSFKGPKTVAYKTLETGNMKPLKQILENDRLPVVRSVELKKPYKMENNKTPEKRPVSLYLENNNTPEKHHVSYLEKNNTPEKRPVSLYLENSNTSEKRPVSYLENNKTAEKRPVSLYVENNKTPEKRPISSYLENSKTPEKRPVSSYLFGFEPSKSEKRFTSVIDLTRKNDEIKPKIDPREQLLQSIRLFGRENLRKVSAR